MDNRIYYTTGHEHQLAQDYTRQVSIKPTEDIETDYIKLTILGLLTLKKGYAWDGNSGVPDTEESIAASAMHDAGYQLIRLRLLSMKTRPAWDLEYRNICKEKGMWRIRAWWRWRGIVRLGKSAADPKNRRLILSAP